MRRALVGACAALLLWGTACGAEAGDTSEVADAPPSTEASTTTERVRPTTTSSTTTSTTSTTSTTTTTAPPPTTTAPPPPPPTTTTAPPPPPPPPTAAPAASGCDPNYTGACVPIASDVDCAGGSGNGPAYVDGPVTIVGSDIYDLDGNDNDGIGCES